MKINKTSLILATVLSATANAEGYYICIPCEKGEYENNGKCTPCPVGSYSNLNGQSKCTPCPAGTYQPNKGQTNCITCPAGYYCPQGSANPQYCDGNAGYWAPAGSASCQACNQVVYYRGGLISLGWGTSTHDGVCDKSEWWGTRYDECEVMTYNRPAGWSGDHDWSFKYSRLNREGTKVHTYCNNTTGDRCLRIERDSREGGGDVTVCIGVSG